MKITVQTPEAQKGFYPTPPNIAEELLSGIDWKKISNVLEPSAGKGNLVDAVASKYASLRSYWSKESALSVDCIEIDPFLRSTLKSTFGEETESLIRDRLRELGKKRDFDCVARKEGELTPEEKLEESLLEHEKRKLQAIEMRVVHDDFLTFESRKRYGLIVMNPPFADGDLHLLKAISMTEKHGGLIRCILNAETLRNPYTNRRKVLMQKLNDMGAVVEFREGAFSDAERETDVDIAIIKLDIPEPQYEQDPECLYQRLKAAAKLDADDSEVTDLTIGDYLESIVAQFNFEVDFGLRLIREYRAMRPYMLNSLDPNDKYKAPIMTLCVGDPSKAYRRDLPDPNKYLKVVRGKYWQALFKNEQFVGKLTSNLQEKYRDMVDELVNYDFTLFNIRCIMQEMNAEMCQGVIDTILSLFDKMTEKHTWYPECQNNVHYFNGWKSNKAHKVNGKVIMPVYGVFDVYRGSNMAFYAYKAYEFLSDIEKAFNYLDGNMTAEVDLSSTLERAARQFQTRNISCKYFDVTFYKKGTAHIKFKNQELLDRFNIFCARHRGWLPPSYGNVKYDAMTQEEQTVVDAYHGDETPGSGEKGYEAVMMKASYYLAPPNQQTFALPGAA